MPKSKHTPNPNHTWEKWKEKLDRKKNPAAVELGKLGGKVKSEKKAIASKENGKKGGVKSIGQKIKEKKAQDDTAPDWTYPCDVCGMFPTVPITGMCGPCTFGEADTIMGNW